MGRIVGTSVTSRAQAMTRSVEECSASFWRQSTVGGSSSISPASNRSRASWGRTQIVAMVSPSSCRATCPGGAAVTKNRVSYRRGASSGVTQWLT